MTHKIAVLGAGAWGTALAIHLCRNAHHVRLYCRTPQVAKQLAEDGVNQRYLPGITLPSALTYCANLSTALANVDSVLIATPCSAFTQMLEAIKQHAPHSQLIWACKGFDSSSGLLLSSALRAQFPAQPAALISGPTFATEVARQCPSALTVASDNLGDAQTIAALFHNEHLRAYAQDDLIGVQVAGALKNVYAIGAGISDGLGLGANARAALITRSLAELSRLGVAMGGQKETFLGLAGLGDLLLTASDNQSRNRRLGLALAKGATLNNAINDIGQAVEGVASAHNAQRLAQRYSVDMPIVGQICAVLNEETLPEKAVRTLLNRTPRPEPE